MKRIYTYGQYIYLLDNRGKSISHVLGIFNCLNMKKCKTTEETTFLGGETLLATVYRLFHNRWIVDKCTKHIEAG